jgi:hypothetical protein
MSSIRPLDGGDGNPEPSSEEAQPISNDLSEITPADKLSLERARLSLDRYRVQLDYRKFVLGSVFVALAIAAIPPLFQLATAVLEYTKSRAERQAKQQEFRDQYIKEFISNALNQDIELRIRFAQYFARVSTEPSREDWNKYLDDLQQKRSEIRTSIDKMEADLSVLSASSQRDEVKISQLVRNLDWAYAEVGYVARNRSAAGNPRTVDPPTGGGLSGVLMLGRFADPTFYLQKAFSWSAKNAEGSSKHDSVTVPAGFVFALDSIPRVYWSLIRPDGTFTQAAVLHDYLYWTQSRSRSEADEIFRQAMTDLGVDPQTVVVLSNGVRLGGQAAWDENAKRKANGEKRILKLFPSDPKMTWDEWKQRPGVFADPQ